MKAKTNRERESLEGNPKLEVDSILNPSDYNVFLENIKAYAKGLKRNVSTHQLRNIFSKVKTISDPRELYPLRYKIAYIAGRDPRNQTLKSFCDLLDDLIKEVKTQEQLKRFQEFFEAVIAYHKYFGGD